MKAGHAQDVLLPLVDFLADYTVKHFSHEEGCMARHQCSVAAANKAAHQRFLHTVSSFRKNLEMNGPTVSLVLEAQRELSDWVRNHIIRTDTHLRECALEHSGR